MKKALDCKYPGVTFQKTCLGMGPKFIHIVRPGCDIFIRAVMNRVECVYLPFRMFFISLRVNSYARNIISAQAGVNLTFVMHVQCSMNAFIRLEYLKLLWGLFFCFPSLSLSLSPSVTCQKDCILLSSGMLVRSGGPSLYILPWSCFDLAEDREQLFFHFPFSPSLFLFLRQPVCLLHALSLNNALFEQCAHNSGYRRARRIDFYHLLFPVILLTLLFH